MKSSDVKAFVNDNYLFTKLTPDVRDKILLDMKVVHLKLGTTICSPGDRPTHVYFPVGSVFSLLTVFEDGTEIECASIGYEGVFGLFPGMYSRMSFYKCIVQSEGAAFRCNLRTIQNELQRSQPIRDYFISYFDMLLMQVLQIAACNSVHCLKERLCRRILTMADRLSGVRINYTHEFLARTMGVNRTSVSLAAKSLQNQGLIIYRRGIVEIIDRNALEASSCECYGIIRKILAGSVEETR